MLDVRALTFDYQYQPLLAEVTFSLPEGCLLHLRGSNGSGKTTLLRLLAGFIQPLKGDICFNGQSIYENSADYQRNIEYVGHRSGVNSLLTLRENCLFDMHWSGSTAQLDQLLMRFDLYNLGDTLCGRLSAGQNRRAGLLRLAMRPARLWLLDEPLVALDSSALEALMMLMTTHVQAGGMIVLTSHQALPISGIQVEEYCL